MNPREDVLVAVEKILFEAYGKSNYAESCALCIAKKIYGGADQREVMLTLWDWFSGGTKAASTSRKIMEAVAS